MLLHRVGWRDESINCKWESAARKGECLSGCKINFLLVLKLINMVKMMMMMLCWARRGQVEEEIENSERIESLAMEQDKFALTNSYWFYHSFFLSQSQERQPTCMWCWKIFIFILLFSFLLCSFTWYESFSTLCCFSLNLNKLILVCDTMLCIPAKKHLKLSWELIKSAILSASFFICSLKSLLLDFRYEIQRINIALNGKDFKCSSRCDHRWWACRRCRSRTRSF